MEIDKKMRQTQIYTITIDNPFTKRKMVVRANKVGQTVKKYAHCGTLTVSVQLLDISGKEADSLCGSWMYNKVLDEETEFESI